MGAALRDYSAYQYGKEEYLMDQAELRRLIQLEGRVRQLEAAMQALLFRLDIDPAEVMPQEKQPEMRGMTDEIQAELQAGNKIMAIKLYRERYNVGLKEAKDAIDAMERPGYGWGR